MYIFFKQSLSHHAGMLRNKEFRLFNRKFSRRVAEIRRERGMTQAVFAERMKVDVRQVPRWELGRFAVTLLTIWRLSKALECSPKDFYDEPKTLKLNRGRPRKTLKLNET
jgi:transcriptional regulator with XRE-family HTH domain